MITGSSLLNSRTNAGGPAGTPLPRSNALISPKDSLKITKLETFLVKPRWLFLKVYTDAGFDGPIRPDHTPTLVGEANNNPGYAMEGKVLALGWMRGILKGSGRDCV